MTFILTKLGMFEGKVHDPDRNIELVGLGGGSDLTRRYRLVGPFDRAEFNGRTFGGTPSQSQAAEGIRDLINWQIRAADRPFRFGPRPEDIVPLRDLIVEAMMQYGYAADKKATDLVSVKFLSPRGVVE